MRHLKVFVGSHELKGDEARKAILEASISLRVSKIMEEREREKYRPIDAPDRPSVKRAMDAVEARLVDALWTLARISTGGSGGRCGLAYIQEASDRFSNAVLNGGKWEEVRPRAPLPSPKAIDAMHEPMGWLAYLPTEQARLVSVAAGTKRGDASRSVSWGRVRDSLIETRTQSIRTLQRRYEGGLRAIVAGLTEDAMSCKN